MTKIATYEYVQKQKKWIDENNIKVGDKVRILKKAKSYEKGWGAIWNDDMGELLGKEYNILRIFESNYGIGLNKHNKSDVQYMFPYFILEKVIDKPVEVVRPVEIIIQPSKTYSLKEARELFRK